METANALERSSWYAYCNMLDSHTNDKVWWNYDQGIIEMLVLSRRVGEKLRLGDEIVLTINRINGNRVRIAIEAPRDVSVLRDELTPFPKDGMVEIEPARVPIAQEQNG